MTLTTIKFSSNALISWMHMNSGFLAFALLAQVVSLAFPHSVHCILGWMLLDAYFKSVFTWLISPQIKQWDLD